LGSRWSLSLAYMCAASRNWRTLLTQPLRLARSLAPDKAGNNMAARIAIMAMTTRSSINVNASRFGRSKDFKLGSFTCVRSYEKIVSRVFSLSSLGGRRGLGRGGFLIFSQLLRG